MSPLFRIRGDLGALCTPLWKTGRMDEKPARESLPHSIEWSMPGLRVHEVTIPVPLNHANPHSSPTLPLFARIVSTPEGAENSLPYLVYLQGGPGSEAPRPTSPDTPAWLGRALKEYRVVMLDQRGTGRSGAVGLDTPLPDNAIPGASTLRAATPAEQAAYLTHFRADSIVNDAELLRAHLGAEQWALLGQSFGGFTTLRYLSAAGYSVSTAIFTGGLPAVATDPTTVYRTTWEGMATRSEKMWRHFPADRERLRMLADRAAAGTLRLADGSRIGVERLRRIGMLLGRPQGEEKLHYLLNLDPNSPAFQHDLAAALPFSSRNPIYAVLHESCWADGIRTRWAAERAMPEIVREDPTLLAGEHMHREALVEDPGLAPFAEAAEILAEYEWPRLYSEESLGSCEVPAAASVYYGDAYVPLEYSMRSAAMLVNLTPWVTSEYEHGGLAHSGTVVLDHLLDLAAGRRAM